MKGPLYRSDDYEERVPGSRPVGVEGTREEVEAYEAKQRDPFAGMHFPYMTFQNNASDYPRIRASANLWQVKSRTEADVLVGGANLLPLLKAYKEARIAERGEQHLLADPGQPVLWHIKELFDAYDKVAELARKV